MKTLAFATIKELKQALKDKKISRQEILQDVLARFEKYDKNLGSALEVFDKESILAQSKDEGLLGGIPGVLKDNICQEGRNLTCASKILQGYRASYDATATERLKKEGALLVARANMDEFAMGTTNETSAYQQTKNPWDKTRVPGGSSGGPIAAVAAGLVPWGLGSETGGSVRFPAAVCNIVGLKPTYGAISRYGLVAYGSSLDQIGIASRTVYDNAAVFSVIAGQDSHDATTMQALKQKDYTQELTGKLPEGLRIGIVDNALEMEGMDPEAIRLLEDSVKTFESLGAKIKHISLPSLEYGVAAYLIISRAEAASNLARFDGVRYGLRNKDAENLLQMYKTTRHDGFGPEVKIRILVGNFVLSAGHADQFYQKADLVRRFIRKDFDQAFADVDVLLMPTNPGPAPKFNTFGTDTLKMALLDCFTCPMNLAGVPALSVPCGFTSGKMPIGLQLVGPHLSEQLLFQVGHAYEQQTPWHTMCPPGFE